MKTIKERRLEILDWEKDNRTKGNRSADKRHVCFYAGEIGCAIGRLLKKEEIQKEWEGKPVTRIFNCLPKKIQSLDVGFLQSLQYLHDNYKNWNEKGLSKLGKEKYQRIKNEWCSKASKTKTIP